MLVILILVGLVLEEIQVELQVKHGCKGFHYFVKKRKTYLVKNDSEVHKSALPQHICFFFFKCHQRISGTLIMFPFKLNPADI